MYCNQDHDFDNSGWKLNEYDLNTVKIIGGFSRLEWVDALGRYILKAEQNEFLITDNGGELNFQHITSSSSKDFSYLTSRSLALPVGMETGKEEILAYRLNSILTGQPIDWQKVPTLTQEDIDYIASIQHRSSSK